MILLFATLMAAGCGSTEGPRPTPGPPVRDILGIAGFPGRGNTPPDDAGFHAEALAQANITWVRGDVLWALAEPERGRWDWSEVDRRIDAAGAGGKRIIAMLAYGVPWASAQAPDGETLYPPDDPEDFARFAAAAVERYGDRVAAWEVWNEPNVFRFWRPSNRGDPAAYAALLAATGAAIKAVDPDAVVLFAGLFFHDQVLSMRATEFIDAAHDAVPDLEHAYDGISVHPYDLYPPSMPPESDEGDSLPMTEMVRQIAGDRGKDVWVTEFGWPVHPRVSEEAQAAYLARSFLLLSAADVRAACWYTLWDGPAPNPLIPEDSFGLFRWQDVAPAAQPPTPKPAWTELLRLVDNVGDLGFVEDLSNDPDTPEGWRSLLFAEPGGPRKVRASWDPRSDAPPEYVDAGP